MSYPLFLDLEGSSYDEDSYPIAAAWSLPDGQIKSVLIVPEDDWQDWDPGNFAARGITREYLFEQGYSALEVIREMIQDLADARVYMDGMDYDRELLEKLFDVYGEEPNFELTPIAELIPGMDYERFAAFREQALTEAGLSPYEAESSVYAMLKLADDLGIKN